MTYQINATILLVFIAAIVWLVVALRDPKAPNGDALAKGLCALGVVAWLMGGHL